MISKLLRRKSLQTTEIYLQAINPSFRETMRLLEGNVMGFLGEQITVQENLLTYSPKKKGFKVLNLKPLYLLVPKRGFEPRRGNPHWTLNPARLPVPPLRPEAGENLRGFTLAISEFSIYNFTVNLVKAKLRKAPR